jgi:hypothetical protein
MCVHTAKAPSHAEIPWYSRRQRFAFGSSLRRCCSRRAGTLSATPFTFGPSAADQFSLSYPSSGFFADTFVSTTGTAEVTSFGGFLGIPVERTTYFTDMRGGHDVLFGPDQFGSYASFRPRPISPIPRSIVFSAFATQSGTIRSTDLRDSPEAIFKLTGSRPRLTSTSTQTPRLWRSRSFQPGR